MKVKLGIMGGVVALLLAFAAAAYAWVHPTPKTVTCDSGTFVVPKGAHETSPWLYTIYVNGVEAESGTVSDTATRYAPGTITVPLASVRPFYVSTHVKVTVNGPGGYSDGGATVEGDVVCDQQPPPPPPPPAPPTPPAATPPAQQVLGTAIRHVAPKCEHRTVHGRKVIVCAKKPHKCAKGTLRVQKRVKHGPKKGQRYTICFRPKPKPSVQHFTG